LINQNKLKTFCIFTRINDVMEVKKIIKCPNCNSTNIETRESWRRLGPPKKTSAHPLMLPRKVSYGYKCYAHYCNDCTSAWEVIK